MREIESESQFFWQLLLKLLYTPVTLFLFLLGKKRLKHLLEPLHYALRFSLAPRCTVLIILLNAAAFLLSYVLPVDALVHVPSNTFTGKAYTLVTTGFLHANWAHFFGNMAGIFVVGRIVEKRLGFFRTGLLYAGAIFLASLFSSLIHYFILNDNTAAIGASGGLMGLVAAAILLEPFYVTYKFFVPLPILLVGWLAVFADIAGIINPTEDGIGHVAHLAGFISISMVMFVLGRDRKKLRKGLWMSLLTLAAGIVGYFLLAES